MDSLPNIQNVPALQSCSMNIVHTVQKQLESLGPRMEYAHSNDSTRDDKKKRENAF